MGIQSLSGSLSKGRMSGKSQVIVGAKVQHFLAAVNFYCGSLRGYDDSFLFIQAGLLNAGKFLLQMFLNFSVHM